MDNRFENYLSFHKGFSDEFNKDFYNSQWRGYLKCYQGYYPANKDAKILDIGCGTGKFLYTLKQEGYSDYTGIDLSQENVDFVKKHITPNCFYTDAVSYLKDKDDHFDFIIMNEVLEHIPIDEIIPTLAQIHKSLKKGGYIIAMVPNMENPICGAYTRYSDFTHTIGYTQNSLQQAFFMSGYEKVSVLPWGNSSKAIKLIKYIPHRVIQKFIEIVFEYPSGSIMFSRRIFAVATK